MPDPDDEDLDNLPPPPPVYYAEQALLGALLFEPHRLTDVTGTIDPTSFSVHAHGVLFTAIRDLPAPDPARHATETHWLNAVLNTARPQAPGLTASYLHSLVQICPWPRHAPAYARMIEAEHDRRLLRTAAQRLAQTAQDATLPHPVPTTLNEADTLASVADSIAVKLPPHPGSVPRTPAPPHTTIHADEEALDEERLMLATATAHPGSITQMRWLSAEDFTHAPHAVLWQCLAALTRRRAAIDPVTVLWEAQQRGSLAAWHEPRDLLELLAVPVGSPEHWGGRILQRSILATAHHVARRIEAFTNDPATTPHQLITGSRRTLADLSAVRTRWYHATSPAPTTTTRARSTAQPRAGPPQTTAPHPARISH